ncbi:MAG: sulfate ABC transporter permease subunit CysT [Leptospirales bacterium]|nr:sulfate ABC transporter permease subunit CysT [Leptospirales bacterium]
MAFKFRERSVLPGFGLSLGITLLYIGLIVLIPLSALILKTATMGWGPFWETVSDERVVASYKLSFGVSAIAALINGFFGVIIAYVLVRYEFPGKRILDALVDIPFAMPTAVSGIALTSVYSDSGALGSLFAKIGIKTAYSPVGVFIALVFIGLPFVVRTVQPVLTEFNTELEEAASSLGANRIQIFRRVIFPEILPSVIIGTSLAFARAAGEYGSVVFISGNMPFKTEITPLLIITKLEQFDYTGATAIAVVMLAVSFSVLLLVNAVQWWSSRRG